MDGTVVDSVKLEQSLCHVLMDKAILNCLLLLDKAAMESRIKTLAEQQTRLDYSGMVNSIIFYKRLNNNWNINDNNNNSNNGREVLEWYRKVFAIFIVLVIWTSRA